MSSWEVVQTSLKTSVLESSEFSVAWTNVAKVFTPKIRQVYSHAQEWFYNSNNTKQVVSNLFTFYIAELETEEWIFHGINYTYNSV